MHPVAPRPVVNEGDHIRMIDFNVFAAERGMARRPKRLVEIRDGLRSLLVRQLRGNPLSNGLEVRLLSRSHLLLSTAAGRRDPNSFPDQLGKAGPDSARALNSPRTIPDVDHTTGHGTRQISHHLVGKMH